MAEDVPRLRMFAGPNGSGKSTLKDVVRPEWLGFYVNADEIEVALASSRGFDFASFGIDVSEPELRDFLRNHPLLVRAGLAASSEYLVLERMRLWFGTVAGNSYFAAAIADLVRRRLLARRVAFSFETVMSSQDKVRFLYEARNAGYRTYLYYIATEDPEINVSRVENRVRLGGHGVPRDKIVQRYHRSLSLLTEAIYYSNRAYIFDNSGESVDRAWIAEFTDYVDGIKIHVKGTPIPAWFLQTVLQSEFWLRPQRTALLPGPDWARTREPLTKR